MNNRHKDEQLYDLLKSELRRQQETLSLIPSENYTYPEVLEILGSVTMNKYSEGYPNKRYYNGNKFIDQIEELAINRACVLFNAKYANVQAYSGSPANLAVYFALLNPMDKVMGLDLSHGGHLTHGAKVNFSGRWFQQIPIQLETDGSIDYNRVNKLVEKEKPKMIVAGITAYPRELDYSKLSQIAKNNDCYLIADLSHTNGLVIAGIHSNPLDCGVDIVTTTTHKLLRGPRGALILTNREELIQKINKAIMPGLQGGPHNNQTAAIAYALEQANTSEYKEYANQVIRNAKILEEVFLREGLNLVSNGTDNHLLVIDLRNNDISGKTLADKLEEIGLITNANTIPNDPAPPLNPSGIRIGTPAITTRGLKEKEARNIAEIIVDTIRNKGDKREHIEKVVELTKAFPIYENKQI